TDAADARDRITDFRTGQDLILVASDLVDGDAGDGVTVSAHDDGARLDWAAGGGVILEGVAVGDVDLDAIVIL
ncbi:MAG: hypothetical protein AAF394_11430, partial [Planctomycetota bacterium]